MPYIILFIVLVLAGVIVINIIKKFFSKHAIGITIAITLLIAFVLAGLKGILWVIGILFAGIIIMYIMDSYKEAAEDKKKAAETNHITQKSKEAHDNERALQEELDENCKELGFMNIDKWKEKLPNYAQKRYNNKSFEEIVANFAQQMEQQNIIQNDDWFTPFIEYIVGHPGGTSASQLLERVECPQLRFTHATDDKTLLLNRLEEGTHRIAEDVPAIFTTVNVNIEDGKLYKPSRALLYQHGIKEKDEQTERSVEIDINDI